jgi:orotate phosphoribosyltransferase
LLAWDGWPVVEDVRISGLSAVVRLRVSIEGDASVVGVYVILDVVSGGWFSWEVVPLLD